MALAPLRFTHPERILDPESGVTKRELADYYAAVAGPMMRHVARRPLSLLRCPDGIGKKCFFQKHAMLGMAKEVERFVVGDEEILAIDSARGLEALVQFGVVEIHVWGSHVGATVEEPDLLVFDLDPDEAIPFSRVARASLVVRDGLRTLGLQSFVKTTGGKGLHVCAPIVPEAAWPQVKELTHLVASTFARALPKEFVAIAGKRARAGKIFIDYLRNGRGATSVAAYSARARPGMGVSMPIAWSEVMDIHPSDFTVRTVPGLLAKRRDPWAAYAKTKQRLPSGGALAAD